MIIQIANIGASFIIAAPKLKELVGPREIERLERVIAPYLNQIGLVELGIGVIALLTRMGIANIHISDFGASYPQAFPATATGAVIAVQFSRNIPR